MPASHSRAEVAALVDHTLLKPEATESDVRALAAEAAELGTYAICVSPSMTSLARECASAAQVVCAVVGFPSGKHRSAIKAEEARLAVDDGAAEIDMVIDVGAALHRDFDAVRADVGAVRSAIGGRALKVIVESAALLALGDEETLLTTCRVAADAGADFVKTSTGFHPAGGASVRAVELMATVGPQVKASGGIRTTVDAIAMLDAGATRLGLSGTRAVLEGLR
ncbi:deoxyribose-phosphate aldolase [Mycobacterium sp. E740]|uniref:deoxyribose-phosphate aldolase n=1 Tax=Mycobacterium sp. E740 TaxID=1834149 RepID=UPI0007FC5DC4|nr:deoxyribose-phosphate aldolase [Mycobacterium sp. E740]OBI84035.1 deoxyribose-phosphate aldolase [Mycobacterium sp. E740]